MTHQSTSNPFYSFIHCDKKKGSHTIEVVFFATIAGNIKTIIQDLDELTESELLKKNIKNSPEFQTIKTGFEGLKIISSSK